MRQGICNCLVLYDWKNVISPEDFHTVAIDLFKDQGILPTLCSIINEQGNEKECDYIDNLNHVRDAKNGFELYHTIDKYKQIAFGWDVMTSMTHLGGKTLTLCWSQSLAGLPIEWVCHAARRLCILSDMSYGIGYQRDFRLGPDLYAYGMVSGLKHTADDIAAADRIGAWFRERLNEKRHLAGMLRDIYPYNILSDAHLSQRMNGISLKDWIKRDHANGRLSPITRNNWLWEIDCRSIEDIRKAARDNGLVICV